MFYLISAIAIIGVSFTIRYFSHQNYLKERALIKFNDKNIKNQNNLDK